MPMTVSKRFRFSASHRLTTLPADDPCSRVHGHNYEVVLTLKGDSLDRHGMVINFHDLRPFKEWLDEVFDHRHINEVVPWLGSPTAERIAVYLYDFCKTRWTQTHSLRLYETADSWVEYSEDDAS